MENLSDRILDILEDIDFSVAESEMQNGEYYVEIRQYTPAGEDWVENIWYDGTGNDFIKSVRNRADDFDVDEEAEKWIDSRGKGGCPNSIRELLDDSEWKKARLEELAYNLEEYVIEEGKIIEKGLISESEIEIVMNALAGHPTCTTAAFADKIEKILRNYM